MRRIALLLAALLLSSCGGISTGNPGSDFRVGMMYLNGVGVSQDAREAVNFLTKAAEAGDVRAEFQLGVLYDNGQSVDKDPAKAFEWFRKAATGGLPQAMYNVGNAYRTGVGTDRDYPTALEMYKQAALKGYGPAAHNVGAMSGNGEGTPQSDAEAYRWLLLASKLGVQSDVTYKEKFRPSLSKSDQRQIEKDVSTLLQSILASSSSSESR